MGRSARYRLTPGAGWDERHGWPFRRLAPARRTSPIRGRVEDPNATCCWARSKSSRLRSSGGTSRYGRDCCRPGPGDLPAEIDFLLWMGRDREPCATQHRLHAGPVRRPPIRGIIGVFVLDEMHLRIAGAVKVGSRPKIVIALDPVHVI